MVNWTRAGRRLLPTPAPTSGRGGAAAGVECGLLGNPEGKLTVACFESSTGVDWSGRRGSRASSANWKSAALDLSYGDVVSWFYGLVGHIVYR